MLSISIVIYLLDPEQLKDLLSSIARAIENLPEKWQRITIVLIDNGNQSSAISDVVSEINIAVAEISIITCEKNIGFGQGHNLALKNCKSKYHLILNPDVTMDKLALIEGISFLEQHKNINAISPFVCNGEGQQEYLCKRYPSIIDLLLRGFAPKIIQNQFRDKMQHYECRDLTRDSNAVQVEIISGCFMLCKTESLLKANGFDRRYFLYFEDFALSIEMNKTGLLYYVPSVKICHLGGYASRKGIRHIFMFISSANKFFNQYGWKII